MATMEPLRHLMGLSKAQIMERLDWLQSRSHFPGASDEIVFLHYELALRFA